MINSTDWTPINLYKTQNRIPDLLNCDLKNILVTLEMNNGKRYVKGVSVYHGFIQQKLKDNVVAVRLMPEPYIE